MAGKLLYHHTVHVAYIPSIRIMYKLSSYSIKRQKMDLEKYFWEIGVFFITVLPTLIKYQVGNTDRTFLSSA